MPPSVRVGPFRKYESLLKTLDANSNQRHFGGSTRPPLAEADTNNPGPAKYNPDAKLARPQSAPSYGMGRRLDPTRPKSAVGRDTPGPGEYRLKDTLNKTGTTLRGKTIRGAGRPESIFDIRPGVGHYDPKPQTKGPSPSFGPKTRPSSAPAKQRPAEGAVPMGPVSTLTRGGARFGPRPKERPASAAPVRPGPGDYAVPSCVRYDVGRQFGRRVEPPKRSMSVPGPGEYAIPSTLGSSKSPHYSISFKQKDRTKDNTGPGPYILPTAVRYDIGRAFGRKVEHPNNASSAPGPGAYSIPTKFGMDRSPKFTMLARRQGVAKPLFGQSQLLLRSTMVGPKFSFGPERPPPERVPKRRTRKSSSTAEQFNPERQPDDYPDAGDTWAPSERASLKQNLSSPSI